MGLGEKAEFQEVRIWISGWERKRTETRENKARGKESWFALFLHEREMEVNIVNCSLKPRFNDWK